MKIIICSIMLFIFAITTKSIADCNGCFDLARVEITYKDGHKELSYMYIDTYYGGHVKQPDELNSGFKYNILKEYIDIYDGKLDLDKVSTALDASIFVTNKYKYTLDPSIIRSVKEISINDGISSRNIDFYAYETIKNKKPVDYYSYYDDEFGYAFVAISYNEKINEILLKDIFNACGFAGEKSIECMQNKSKNLDRVYFFYVELDGC